MTRLIHSPLTTSVALLLASLTLSACGGGGGSSSDAGTAGAASPASNGSLSVELQANGRTIAPTSGVYLVEDPSALVVRCNEACEVQTSRRELATVSTPTIDTNAWSATVDFESPAGVLDLRVAAPDGSAVTLSLRTPAAVGQASWSLDQHRWTRTNSTQQTLGGQGSSPLTSAMVVNSAGTSACKSGPYECGTVSIHWVGTGTGTFTLDPDFLTRTSPLPGTAWVNAKATGGQVDNRIPNCTPLMTIADEGYYNTDYRAPSGQIRISKGADGQFRVSTVEPVTVQLQPNSENPSLCLRSIAAPDAPATMRLELNEVF